MPRRRPDVATIMASNILAKPPSGLLPENGARGRLRALPADQRLKAASLVRHAGFLLKDGRIRDAYGRLAKALAILEGPGP